MGRPLWSTQFFTVLVVGFPAAQRRKTGMDISPKRKKSERVESNSNT